MADADGELDWDVNIDSSPISTPPGPQLSTASKGAAEGSVHVHAWLRDLLAEAVRQTKDSAAPAAG
ncbi:hypothetical protein [Streptomyces sp. 1222.5]|uniref:hypothetical protein n=1 Tax=Streptomyces sp. 1222.5 TaxID=1881026 RepID=UPI0015A02456|nr:hypothetical protein [Streptomyces sp. 1222.5]